MIINSAVLGCGICGLELGIHGRADQHESTVFTLQKSQRWLSDRRDCGYLGAGWGGLSRGPFRQNYLRQVIFRLGRAIIGTFLSLN